MKNLKKEMMRFFYEMIPKKQGALLVNCNKTELIIIVNVPKTLPVTFYVLKFVHNDSKMISIRNITKLRIWNEGLLLKNKEFMRGAGILLSVTSLPSAYGIGTLGTEAYQFIDLLAELRQRYWQVLPLGPTSYGDSPYQSFSAFAGNPYLIDLDALVKDKLLTTKEVRSFDWGNETSGIDYGKLYENRFQVLELAFVRFQSESKEFHSFCKKNEHWLEDYACYMAIKKSFANVAWLEWDEDIKNRDPEVLKQYKEKLTSEILFWKFCQFKFFEQWDRLKSYANRNGIEIIGDIPLYVALDSADVWAHRDLFLLNEMGNPSVVAGCPPDAFSSEGQKWGNPIFDWNRMEKDGFSWWAKRIKANAEIFDVLRMDHFIGVVKYYSIPAKDKTAKNGKWNKGPGKKLTDVIEKAIGNQKLIVEDLGVFVPGVKKLIQKTGWPGMKILIFAFDGNTAHEYLPHNFEDRNRVVYAGTHDNETVVGYFNDKTDYELAFLYEYLNIRSRSEIPSAFIRLAYSSIADVVIFQMQDILELGNEARMNYPSTVGTNWKWRMWKDALSEEQKSFIRTMATIYRR